MAATRVAVGSGATKEGPSLLRAWQQQTESVPADPTAALNARRERFKQSILAGRSVRKVSTGG